VPTAAELSRLEPPGSGRHLAEVVADAPRARGGVLRQKLARMRSRAGGGEQPRRSGREEEPPVTARTPYGFYPAYDPELLGGLPDQGHLVVRVPAPHRPRIGEPMTVAVDLDRMLLFDRTGNRIRLDRT
jgi:multiple sugar transport system ATP-binding protein